MKNKREAIGAALKREVLAEAGYRCGVPTCRSILAIDLHHLVEVAEGGANELSNLIALCPNCHALFHRGTIVREAIQVWKGILVALGRAFDQNTIDALLFLSALAPGQLSITGDGVLKYDRLIGNGLAEFRLVMRNGPLVNYEIGLTQNGRNLVAAWKSGDRQAVTQVLSGANGS